MSTANIYPLHPHPATVEAGYANLAYAILAGLAHDLESPGPEVRRQTVLSVQAGVAEFWSELLDLTDAERQRVLAHLVALEADRAHGALADGRAALDLAHVERAQAAPATRRDRHEVHLRAAPVAVLHRDLHDDRAGHGTLTRTVCYGPPPDYRAQWSPTDYRSAGRAPTPLSILSIPY